MGQFHILTAILLCLTVNGINAEKADKPEVVSADKITKVEPESPPVKTKEQKDEEIKKYYENILSYLGLINETNIDPDINAVLKDLSIKMEEGKRSPEIYKEETENFKKRGEDVVAYFTSYFKDKDPVTIVKGLVEVPIKFLESFAEMAPLNDWKRLFDLYARRPDLLKKIGIQNRAMIFLYWSVIFGDQQPLKNGISNFVNFSKTLSILTQIVEGFQDEESPTKPDSETTSMGENAVEADKDNPDKISTFTDKPKSKKRLDKSLKKDSSKKRTGTKKSFETQSKSEL